LTMPGSSGGGWFALDGRIPVSAQLSDWAAAPGTGPSVSGSNGAGGSGRAAAARIASAHMDSTACLWKACQSRT
jgi:hypothetical protein